MYNTNLFNCFEIKINNVNGLEERFKKSSQIKLIYFIIINVSRPIVSSSAQHNVTNEIDKTTNGIVYSKATINFNTLKFA